MTADETFTDQEFEVILNLCGRHRGTLAIKETAKECGIAQNIVMTLITSIFDKADLVSGRDLLEFVKTALNAELLRRQAGNLEKE